MPKKGFRKHALYWLARNEFIAMKKIFAMKIHRNEKGEIHRISELRRILEEFPNELENPPNFAQKVDIFVKKPLIFHSKTLLNKKKFQILS